MEFSIRIANKKILIQSLYSSVYHLCKDYFDDTSDKPDMEIHISEDMVTMEANKIEQYQGEKSSLGAVEGLLVHRIIAEALLDHDTVLLHGAVVAFDNKSYLFTGPSGTGKTTHVQKWLDNVDNAFVVNGDKPLIIIGEKEAYACGTPWCGKEHYGKNAIVPLRSIVFMERSNDNRIEPATFKSVFPLLLQQTYHVDNADKMRKTLALLSKLKDQVSFYRFYFDNYKEDCFSVAFKELVEKK